MSLSNCRKNVERLIIVTSEPISFKNPAHYTAIYPPPITRVFLGACLSENKSSLVITHSLTGPSVSYGYRGLPPTAIINFFALISFLANSNYAYNNNSFTFLFSI